MLEIYEEGLEQLRRAGATPRRHLEHDYQIVDVRGNPIVLSAPRHVVVLLDALVKGEVVLVVPGDAANEALADASRLDEIDELLALGDNLKIAYRRELEEEKADLLAREYGDG